MGEMEDRRAGREALQEVASRAGSGMQAGNPLLRYLAAAYYRARRGPESRRGAERAPDAADRHVPTRDPSREGPGVGTLDPVRRPLRLEP